MISLFLVDAFADRPFAGNPAAVCLLESAIDEGWLRAIAAELNQPAAAFVWSNNDGFDLRWFSPTTELALCGHGTLASAHGLWEERRLGADAVASFATAAGILRARRIGRAVELDFPTDEVSPAEALRVGIDEDAVTGSAHCALGPYWQRRLGKAEIRAFQASARGDVVVVRVNDGRAFISGPAVTVLRAELPGP